jgi:hypothetical protein
MDFYFYLYFADIVSSLSTLFLIVGIVLAVCTIALIMAGFIHRISELFKFAKITGTLALSMVLFSCLMPTPIAIYVMVAKNIDEKKQNHSKITEIEEQIYKIVTEKLNYYIIKK